MRQLRLVVVFGLLLGIACGDDDQSDPAGAGGSSETGGKAGGAGKSGSGGKSGSAAGGQGGEAASDQDAGLEKPGSLPRPPSDGGLASDLNPPHG